MSDILLNYYPWIKALHIIFVICWMAGLFYLPRLFVYHAQTEPRTPMSEQFLLMEERLIRIIINPAMIMSFVFGICLLMVPGLLDWHSGWLHLKLLLVLAMAGYTGVCIKWYKGFVMEKRNLSHKHFRLANELPVVIMVVIVIMVVVRPF